MTESERNWLAHMERTLADLGSEARQRHYKTAVPFVHIPIELAAQCDAYVHLLEHQWFRALFETDEVAALATFFAKVSDFVGRDVVLDVDDGVLDDQAWREVMAAASTLHTRLVASGRIFPAASAS